MQLIAVRRPALQNWQMLVSARDFSGSPREERTKTSEDQRTKEGDGTNMQHTFFLSRSFSLFLPLLLNPTTKPLLLVSDFYLVAPGSRFISQSPLSFSLDSFSLSFPFPIFFVFPLAIAYKQPAASNSPELLIPDFRPVGKVLAPFLLVLLPTSLSLVAASPTTWSLLSEIA